ncbi:MAG: fibronectin type III domain-containing protein [Proteobacteria bacterium]|nr:fibronectin type III domain-containing protein [Pseudomonadota bacterium]
MIKYLFFVFTVILILPILASADVSVPQNVSLAPGETTIAVSWTSNADDTDTYLISWGTSPDTLDTTRIINSATANSYPITGLEPNTTYYVQVAARDSINNLTQEAATKSATTFKALAPPENFSMTSIGDTSLSVIWDPVDLDDLSGYTVYYTNDPSTDPLETDIGDAFTTATLEGLESGNRYYVFIKTRNLSGDESSPSDTLIIDTKQDKRAPMPPSEPDVKLTGSETIKVDINDTNNKGMVDLKGYFVQITDNRDASQTTLDAGNDTSIDIGSGTEHGNIILENGVTYTIIITAYDQDGNESTASPEVYITVESIQHILIDSDDVKSGCFISTSGKGVNPGRILLMIVSLVFSLMIFIKSVKKRRIIVILPVFMVISAVPAQSGDMKNAIGIKAGYFKMSDTLLDDTFENRFPVPVRLYYERAIYKDFHADIDAGFLKLKGDLLSTSGEDTGVENTYYLIPVSFTLTYNYQLTPVFYAYIGTGLDHWYAREEIKTNGTKEKESHYVGGYHYKCGIAYLTSDPDIYQKYGIQLEAVYAIIDRFGGNDRDLGGITIQAGYFYRF